MNLPGGVAPKSTLPKLEPRDTAVSRVRIPTGCISAYEAAIKVLEVVLKDPKIQQVTIKRTPLGGLDIEAIGDDAPMFQRSAVAVWWRNDEGETEKEIRKVLYDLGAPEFTTLPLDWDSFEVALPDLAAAVKEKFDQLHPTTNN